MDALMYLLSVLLALAAYAVAGAALWVAVEAVHYLGAGLQGESTRDATIAQGLDPCAVAGN